MRKTSTRLIVPIFVLIALIAGNMIIRMNSLSIIQESGVKAYNTTENLLNIITLILGVLCVGSIVFFAIREQKKRKTERLIEVQKQLEQEKVQKIREEANAKFSPSKSLDDDFIYEHLQAWQDKEWGKNFPEQISSILKQMDDMNRYQNKLSKLIANNGASYLNDSEEVLANVEQHILINVRNILNCFDVYETSDQKDVQKMQILLTSVKEDNDVKLKNVKEFLLATTDFVNKQGDDNTGIETLNMYKEVIINSLKEDTIDEPILKI